MQYDLPDDDALRPSALYCPCHSLMGISKTQKSVAGYVVIWIEKCTSPMWTKFQKKIEILCQKEMYIFIAFIQGGR